MSKSAFRTVQRTLYKTQRVMGDIDSGGRYPRRVARRGVIRRMFGRR